MKKILNIKSIVFLILSISIIVFLVTIFDFEKITEILRRVKLRYIFAASFCYLCSNFFKTVRFKYFFSDIDMPFGLLFSVVSYHNFYNQIMPARTGEFTLIYYLKKICNTNVSKGFHSLLVVRFMDLFIVAVFFVLSFIFSSAEKLTFEFLTAAIIFGIFSITIVIFLGKFFSLGFFIIKGFTDFTHLSKYDKIKKIIDKLENMKDSFNKESIIRKIPALTITSIFVWGALYTFSFLIIRAFSVDMTYFESVLGATASVLTNVLPINSFGSFGTMEAGWVGGYMLVGVKKNIAIISAFTYHLVNFFTAGIIALICRTTLLLQRENNEINNSNTML